MEDSMSENEIRPEMFSCDMCGTETEYQDEIYHTDAEGELCSSCYEEYFFHCESCNEETHCNDMCEIEGANCCQVCFDNESMSCYGCDERFWDDNLSYNEQNDCSYCESCYDEHDHSSHYEWNVFSNSYVKTNVDFVHPKRHRYHLINGHFVSLADYDNDGLDSFDFIPSHRCQGVEIEFNEPWDHSRIDIRDKLHHDITKAQRRENDPSEVPTSVRIDSDGSITDEDNRYGHEIVMSPRRGDILVNDLRTVCDTVKKEYRGYVSHRCGYHLHIDSRDFDWYHFLMLVGMTKLIEPHIYAFLPSSRRTSHWCKPISQGWNTINWIDGRDAFVDWYYDYTCFSTSKYNDKRYHGLNLHSHFQANQGVELRYHSGTLNPTKMMHWSIFWSQIMDKCYDLATDAYAVSTLIDRDGSVSRPRDWMQKQVFKSITDPLSHIEFSQYGFKDRGDFATYLINNYHYSVDEIDYGKYYDDSRKICDMLGIENPSE